MLQEDERVLRGISYHWEPAPHLLTAVGRDASEIPRILLCPLAVEQHISSMPLTLDFSKLIPDKTPRF